MRVAVNWGGGDRVKKLIIIIHGTPVGKAMKI